MSSSLKATRVHFDSDKFSVYLSDGRVIGVPLAWFPRLLHSNEDQREKVRISSRGLHWDALDEDISIAALIAGLGDQSVMGEKFAGLGRTRFLAAWELGITYDDHCPPGRPAIVPPSSVQDIATCNQLFLTTVGNHPIA